MKYMTKRSTSITSMLAISVLAVAVTLPDGQSSAKTGAKTSTPTVRARTITKTTNITSAPFTQSTVTQTTNLGSAPEVNVTVNGQEVEVPANGSTRQTFSSQDGNTQTDVSVERSTTSTGTSTNFSSSTTTSNVYSSNNSVSTSFQQESSSP